jgi:hypothetical protein
MSYKLKNTGFSLTEVLLSVGTLAVGMIFIAGVFPVGIHFTTIATERTIAAIVADEAFAKIKIYAIGDPSKNVPGNDDIDLNELAVDELRDFNDKDIFPATVDIDPNEFTYPSDPSINISRKQYCWSALCRLTEDPNSTNVQVTVFVCRKPSPNLKYYAPHYDWNSAGSTKVNWPTPDEVDWPMPVKVEVGQAGLRDNELRVTNFDIRIFINDGYTIVDDETGRIYRVLERYTSPDNTILLDRDWEGSDEVWVVPPPVNGSRYPCIAVYQKVIRF